MESALIYAKEERIMRDFHNQWKKSQSSIEYAILIAIVAAAFVTMIVYVRGASFAKLKHLEIQLNESMISRSIEGGTPGTAICVRIFDSGNVELAECTNICFDMPDGWMETLLAHIGELIALDFKSLREDISALDCVCNYATGSYYVYWKRDGEDYSDQRVFIVARTDDNCS